MKNFRVCFGITDIIVRVPINIPVFLSLDIFYSLNKNKIYKCMTMKLCMRSGNNKQFDVTEVLSTICGHDGL